MTTPTPQEKGQERSVTITGGAMLALTIAAPVLLACFIVGFAALIVFGVIGCIIAIIILAIVSAVDAFNTWRWNQKRKAKP